MAYEAAWAAVFDEQRAVVLLRPVAPAFFSNADVGIVNEQLRCVFGITKSEAVSNDVHVFSDARAQPHQAVLVPPPVW